MLQSPAPIPATLRELFRDDPAALPGTDIAGPLLTDWRGRFHGSALAVVMPASTLEVSRLAQWCHRHRVAMVPPGGNTGLVGGATPDSSGRAVLVSTRRLNRIRDIDPVGNAITVESGCTLQTVQTAAQDHGRLFPLSLASEGSCTLGGNLASNAGGTQVLRYGNTRDLTLGLEVVLPDGRVWDGLRSLRKDNTGYDLKQLYIGSEGTLGIITAATLKLFARPRWVQTAWVGLEHLADAPRLLSLAYDCAGPSLTAFELVSDQCLALIARQLDGVRMPPFAGSLPWHVLLEWSCYGDAAASGMEALCERALAGGLIADAVVAHSEADSLALWKLRESIPEAQTRAGGNVKHDISLPVATMADFVERVGRRLHAIDPRLQAYVFGHLGDGNLHYNVGALAGVDPALPIALESGINDCVYAAVADAGGSVSAEHGLGQLRRSLAARLKSATELDLMRAVKQALDPSGIMNPGKGLPL